MSEVAGRMSIQAGAHCLEKEQGGRGMLLGGVPGVPPANVVVLGGGVVGTNAARMAVGLEAHVTVHRRSTSSGCTTLDQQFGASVQHDLLDAARRSRTTCCRPTWSSAPCWFRAPRRRSSSPRDMVKAHEAGLGHRRRRHRPGRLFRDLAGRPRMPTRPTCRRRRALLRRQHAGRRGAHLDLRAQQRDAAVRAGAGRQGLWEALRSDPHLRDGLNVYEGQITYPAVAEALGLKFFDPLRILSH